MRFPRHQPLSPPKVLLSALGILIFAGSVQATPEIRHAVVGPIHHREVLVPDSLRSDNVREPRSGLAPDREAIPLRPADVFDGDRDEFIPLAPQDVFDGNRAEEGAESMAVVDVDRARVFPNPSMGSVTVETGSETLTLKVYDASGRRVTHVEGSTGRATWNGRDSSGRLVSPGVYFGRIANGASPSQTVRIVRR